MDKINLDKIKIFLNKYKLVITLLTASIVVFASTFWYPLIYLAAVILAAGMIKSKFNDIFSIMIYSSVLGCFLVPFIASTIVGFIAILINYILDVKAKRIEFLKIPLIITTIIVVLFSLIHYQVNDLGLYQGIMMIGFLYFIYFVICYRKQLNIKKYFDYLFLGLIVSIILSALFYFIPTAQTLSFDGTLGYVMKSMREKVAFYDSEYTRLTLLSFHVNHLASYCLFAMAFSSIIVLTRKYGRKIDMIYYSLMYVINLVVGILTLSKAFIVVFAFEVVVTLIYYFIKNKKKALKVIGILFAVLIFFCIVFRKRFDEIIERFFFYNYDTLLGMLTTGRSAIWQQYVNAILESPLKLLFGFGLFSQEQLLIGPHNFYIFILYRFGVIGIFMIGCLIYAYYRSIKTKLNLSIRKSLIFFTFLVIGLQEACIDERFYFFIIGIALIFVKDKKKENVEIEKNIENKVEIENK